jgi:hypothetical protein
MAVSARVLMVVALAVLSISCGTQPAATPGGSPSAQKVVTPSPEVSPSAPTAQTADLVIHSCPATIVNVSGAFTFECPAGWTYSSCDNSAGITAVTVLNTDLACNGENYAARGFVWSHAGDHSTGPDNETGGQHLGQLQTSVSVMVGGMNGTRRTYLETQDLPLPPPKGTVQVLYLVFAAGRTYFAQYDVYPGDRDLTADFDRMVTETLKFQG